MVRAGAASPAVYFNLGNAFFKQGQIGRAIAAYHSAQTVDPRDPDVRANLGFARERWKATLRGLVELNVGADC